MDWMNLLAIVLDALVPVAVTALGIVLINWLKSKGVKDETLTLLNEAYNLLGKAVVDTNQNYVDAIKASGGKLTSEQQEEARARTKTTFEALLTDEVKLAIEAAYGSIGAYVAKFNDSAVGAAKA